MLTGFNTDIQHDGVVYHVQTEDKGPENPVLLSLVYVGGAILAAKRTHYAKDIEAGMSATDLQVKLEKQHKSILAVINRGRIRELIELRERQLRDQAILGGGVTQMLVAPAFPVPSENIGQTRILTAEFASPPCNDATDEVSAPTFVTERLVSADADVDELLASDFEIPLPADLSEDGAEFVDAKRTKTLGTLDAFLHTVLASSAPASPAPVEASPEPPPPPATAELSFPVDNPTLTGRGTGGLARSASSEFSLDRILAEYMQSGDALDEKLELRLLDAFPLYAGDTVTLHVEVTRSGRRAALPGVSVVAKILGTAFKPQVHSALSGIDGIATLAITLPEFTIGSGAVVIQASFEAKDAEIKQLIRRR